LKTAAEDQAISASTALSWYSPRPRSSDAERQLANGSAGSHEAGVTPTLRIVRSSDELLRLQPEWKALYFRSSPRNPFLSHAWTHACWMAQEDSAQPFVVTLRDGERLLAVAPLCIEKRSGFRILRFIADDRSDYLGFLCEPGSPALERQLLQHVLATSGEWDIAILRQLTDSYTGVHKSPLPRGFQSHITEWIRAPYCKAEGDWETFQKSGPSWFREMPKRSRRFLRDGHRAECFKGVDAIARLDEVSDIEAHSWKGREQTTRLQPGRGRELLRQAFETLGTRGEMELWLAYVDGRAVAFQIDFVMDDRVWHYQTAYNEDYRNTRAGSILTYQALLDAWDRGVREFDYLSGEEPYKLERTNAMRAIYHVAAHRRTARGWLAYALLVAPRWRLRNVPALRALYKKAQALKRGIRARPSA
jgi:CelD/BcsL family acetyltransferase involved in cellulose biosynthesis